jgi:polyadenylate-binding protein 2
MSEEAAKVAAMQNDALLQSGTMNEADLRSIHVGNVDYDAEPAELFEIFKGCGDIVRVTNLCNAKGLPKGAAYVEFADAAAVTEAVKLSGAELRGRQLQVNRKRPTLSGYHRGGARGRGGGRGGPSRGRGGGFRGGGRGGRYRARGPPQFYSPYY